MKGSRHFLCSDKITRLLDVITDNLASSRSIICKSLYSLGIIMFLSETSGNFTMLSKRYLGWETAQVKLHLANVLNQRCQENLAPLDS